MKTDLLDDSTAKKMYLRPLKLALDRVWKDDTSLPKDSLSKSSVCVLKLCFHGFEELLRNSIIEWHYKYLRVETVKCKSRFEVGSHISDCEAGFNDLTPDTRGSGREKRSYVLNWATREYSRCLAKLTQVRKIIAPLEENYSKIHEHISHKLLKNLEDSLLIENKVIPNFYKFLKLSLKIAKLKWSEAFPRFPVRANVFEVSKSLETGYSKKSVNIEEHPGTRSLTLPRVPKKKCVERVEESSKQTNSNPPLCANHAGDRSLNGAEYRAYIRLQNAEEKLASAIPLYEKAKLEHKASIKNLSTGRDLVEIEKQVLDSLNQEIGVLEDRVMILQREAHAHSTDIKRWTTSAVEKLQRAMATLAEKHPQVVLAETKLRQAEDNVVKLAKVEEDCRLAKDTYCKKVEEAKKKRLYEFYAWRRKNKPESFDLREKHNTYLKSIKIEGYEWKPNADDNEDYSRV